MQDDLRQDSRFMATPTSYRGSSYATWSERMSELGLAQSADSFPVTHSTEKIVTSLVVP